MKHSVLCITLISCLLMSSLSWAKVQEIRSIHEVQEEITPQTLVVFDIDNTLITPTGNLGSDQWFFYLQKIYTLKGLPEKESAEKATITWNKTQELIRVKAVESETPTWIQQLQKRGIKTMALTARRADVAEVTKKQLQSIHVEFKTHSPSSQTLNLSKAELQSEEDAIFTDGILLVGEGNNKGLVFKAFLKKIGYTPEKIIFIDDKVKHVNNMEKALSSLSIPYFGYRYAVLDQQVEAFKAQISEVSDQKTAELFFMGQLPGEKSIRKSNAKNQSQNMAPIHNI